MKQRLLVSALLVWSALYGNKEVKAQSINTIQTGAPFLLLSSDARNAGVGEAGTGLPTDANAFFSNPAKIAFGADMAASVSYTPWMRALVKDAQLVSLSGFKKISSRDFVGSSLKYLNLGNIGFRDENGDLIQNYHAQEFSFDATYARKFGQRFSTALTARLFFSDLGSGAYNNVFLQKSSAFSLDLSVFSKGDESEYDGFKKLSWGANLSNIGTKLHYSDNSSSFLPMNLRIGAGYPVGMDDQSKLIFLLDVSKLMLPTPPLYKKDTEGNFTQEIEKGKNPDRSVGSALFTSLFDAPGGLKEELSEFVISAGTEFAFKEQFFFRAGFLYENENKGNRKHVATGLGFKSNKFNFDFSYVLPTGKNYPLNNAMRFTINFTPLEN